MASNDLLIGTYIFHGNPIQEPATSRVRLTGARLLKMWKVMQMLGELGWGERILYADEYLQNKKMDQKERKVCQRNIVSAFKRYCPHLDHSVTNMELHAAVSRLMGEYRPRLKKQDLQALFLIYQKWQTLPEKSVLKARIGQGLDLIMHSGYYSAAVVKKTPKLASIRKVVGWR